MKIGLLSDTHGWLDPAIFGYFESCQEIWHAGDVGNLAILLELAAFRPLRAVYGNIDGQDVRASYPMYQQFVCEGLPVLMTHIGGLPPIYQPDVVKVLKERKVGLFVCGHSHILKVMVDRSQGQLLYVNPGAAGRQGLHEQRTVLRFNIEKGSVVQMEAIVLGSRGSQLPEV